MAVDDSMDHFILFYVLFRHHAILHFIAIAIVSDKHNKKYCPYLNTMWGKDESSYHMKIAIKIVPTNFPGTSSPDPNSPAATPTPMPEGIPAQSDNASSALWRERMMPAKLRSILSHARSRTVMNVEVRKLIKHFVWW